MTTRKYLVVLEVLVDNDSEWWQALGLPDPAIWALSDTFKTSVFPRVKVEAEVKRPQ